MKCYKLFLVFILIAGSTAAQQIHGNVEGRISVQNNIPLPNANIILTGPNLQGVRGTTSDDEGFFNILSLPPGLYDLRISTVGYQTVLLKKINVRLGKTTSISQVEMKVQSMSLPELIITEERFTTDPNSTSYGGNINSNSFRNLPLERNYQNMISLLPQANLSYFGDGVNIAGSTGHENKFFIDGVEVTDPLFGVFSTYLPYNFIKEVEVKAGGYEAEFRSALGGTINVITNSGSNDFHVSTFAFYTNNNFSDHYEKGLLDPTQGNFNDYDIGVSLGGPVIKDKLWFFSAYNPTFANRDVSIPGFGIYVDRTLRHSFAGKLNWNPLNKLRINFTITGDPTNRKAAGRNELNLREHLGNPDYYLQKITEGGYNISLNGSYYSQSNILLDASVAHVIRHDTGDPLTTRGSEVRFNDYFNNFFEGGVGFEWDSYRYGTLSKFTGTIFYKSHNITGGVEFKQNGTDNKYSYHSIERYDNIEYVEYFERGFQTVKQRTPAAFIHDTWKVNDFISIKAGVRWDRQYIFASNNKLIQQIDVPLQPRFGFVIIPDAGGVNKVFGSAGRYSNELALGSIFELFSNQGYHNELYYNSDPRTHDIIADSSFYLARRIGAEIQGLRGQYYDEVNIGYERKLKKNLVLSLQGVYRTLQEAIEDGYVLSEQEFMVGNPGKGLLSAFPRPHRIYKALILTLEQQHNDALNFLVSYVFSRSSGNYEGLFDAIKHGEFPNRNYVGDNPFFANINTTGLLPNDRTHILKFSGSYRFAFGLIAGLSFTTQSGTPLTEYADSWFGVKLLSQRGAVGRSPALWDLNARFVYEFSPMLSGKSRLIVDIFHIASQFKAVDINQFHYFDLDFEGNPENQNPDYGKPYRYQQPMAMRLGIEVEF